MSEGLRPTIRPAVPADAEAVTEIFNQGVEERTATFETHLKRPADYEEMIGDGIPFVVAESEGSVVGFAKAGPYEDASHYYSHVAEATVFVERSARRNGVGRALLEGLVAESEAAGRLKLTAKIFASNEPSVALVRACGFREVGVHERHGCLDGEWKDVVVVERLLDPAS